MRKTCGCSMKSWRKQFGQRKCKGPEAEKNLMRNSMHSLELRRKEESRVRLGSSSREIGAVGDTGPCRLKGSNWTELEVCGKEYIQPLCSESFFRLVSGFLWL